MKIVWDEPKRRTTIERRGLDFADVTSRFLGDAFIADAKEGRLLAVGRLHGRAVTIVFKPLGSEAISIISMRPASRKERESHDQARTSTADHR